MKKKYFKITRSDSRGAYITDEISELTATLDEDGVGTKYILEVVEMSDTEIKELPEFDGF